MRNQATAATVWLHGWTGLLLGWLFFALALSGGFAVLAEKLLHPWLLPQVEASLSPSEADTLMATLMPLQPEGAKELTIRPPGEMHDRYFSAMFELSRDARKPGVDSVEIIVAPVDFDVIEVREGERDTLFTQRIAGSGMLVQQLHTRFLLPELVSQPLSAVLAPTMMLLAFTGLLLQPSVLKELWQNPLHKRELVSWRKFHKLLGAWVFPFLLFMGFSATFFATALPYLAGPASLVKFEGDADGVQRELLASPEGRATRVGDQMPMLGAALTHLQAAAPAAVLTRYTIEELGAPTAVIGIRAEVPGQLCGYGYAFDAYDAALIDEGCGIKIAFAPVSAVINSLLPLHAAHAGGPLISVLWFVFGLASAASIWFGLAYWCGKRSTQGGSGTAVNTYQLLARMNSGFCAGLLATVLALFNLDILLAWMGVHAYYGALHLVLPIALLVAVLACTLPRRQPLLQFDDLLRAAAVFSLAAPLLHGVLIRQFTVAVMLADIIFILLTVILLRASRRSPTPATAAAVSAAH